VQSVILGSTSFGTGKRTSLKELAELLIRLTGSNQPIKYLVNTHYHPDHTGGNELFAKDGVTLSYFSLITAVFITRFFTDVVVDNDLVTSQKAYGA